MAEGSKKFDQGKAALCLIPKDFFLSAQSPVFWGEEKFSTMHARTAALAYDSLWDRYQRKQSVWTFADDLAEIHKLIADHILALDAFYDETLLVGKVLAFGAQKYGAWNWAESGFPYHRLVDAAMRHLAAFVVGDDIDEESDLPHLAHALCCILFLRVQIHKGFGVDDRPMHLLENRKGQ